MFWRNISPYSPSEDESNTFLQNGNQLQDYMVSQPRRLQSIYEMDYSGSGHGPVAQDSKNTTQT
jgi:hypothetical protein